MRKLIASLACRNNSTRLYGKPLQNLDTKKNITILEYIINESTKDEIFNLSILEILSQIGLDKSITSQRTNGFLNALNKIKEQINNYEK